MMSIPSPSHMGTPPHMGTSPHSDSPPHMDSPPHIEIHQELFPDYYGGPASIPSEPKEESLGNDIPNGSNDCAPGVKENNFLVPVQPCTGGEGLPYAPIDWPNPGDIWSWRVGKRVSSSGFYNDRFLTVPKSLRKPNNPKVFASKPTLERFLRSQFPDADIDAFFASFIWKIPAILESPAKANTPPPAIEVEDGEKESNKKTRRSSQRKTSHSGHSDNSKKRQKTTTESVRPRRQTRQHLKNSAPAPSENEETNAGLDMSFLDDEKTREEFDTYLNSLDDMLGKPLCEEPFTHPLMPNSFAAEEEMFEARRKLSSFLDMDFPSLICFKDLDELTSLASKLRKDPTLTAEQLVKLKLIEEIPSFCEVFLENRDVMEQADKFFTALEDNKAKVTSLRQEYSELKEQVTHLQSEVDSNTSTVQEIDNQPVSFLPAILIVSHPLSAMVLLLFFLLSLLSQTQSKPILTVSPKTLSKSGDHVLIQWSGIDSPSKLDWLGLYSPPDSSHDNFIGYKFLSSSPTWESGSGSISLPLTSLRSNYSFRIFRWSESEVNPDRHDQDHNPLPGTDHLLAESERVGFESGRGPEQIHLAWTGREGEMRVMFVAEDSEERHVRYGEKEGEWEGDVAVARAGRYEREDMCHAPANESVGWRDPGWIFDAVMSGLKGGIKYYYQVGSDSKGWSTTRSFVSWDASSKETLAFLFGDMGTATPYLTFSRTQDESISTMKWILRDLEALGDKPALVSHIGDISYARGYSWLWDEFFNLIEPVASKVPYHVCIGNHEYDWPSQPWRPEWSNSIYGTDGGGECGVPYSLRFNMPGNSSEPTGTRAPATQNLYYSFDMGTVHFVYMSTETNFLPGSSQYNFLKHDLESVDRTKTPFVVVQGHRPMYTTSYESRDAPLRQRMLEHLEPLFVKNNVTLALWGHVHRYERFCPLKNFTCGSMGLKGESWEALPVHVVIGMAGQDWQPTWEPRPDHPHDPVYPQPKRSLYRTGEFGYTRLVATKEKLILSFVGNHDGEVHDMVEILASGQVLNGGDGDSGRVGAVLKDEAMEYSFSHYVWGGSVLVLGGFVGYVFGFVSHARKRAASGRSWTFVKSEET